MLNRREFGMAAVTGAGAFAVLSSQSASGASPESISLNIVYSAQDGAHFDMEYYKDKHIPLAMEVMKATSVILIEGIPLADAPAPVAMIAHFQFPSKEAVQAALTQPGMAKVRADIPNFTTIKPVVMLGRTA